MCRILAGIDGGERCLPDLALLAAQSDELKLEISTFLKSKYSDFDSWLDKTSVLHKRYEQLNVTLNSTSQLVHAEVSVPAEVSGPGTGSMHLCDE